MIVSGVGECGSSGHESRGMENADFYSFCQSVEFLHDTVPTPPIENKQSRGSVFKRSNHEPHCLRYQLPGATRTRRSRAFQERRTNIGGGGGRSGSVGSYWASSEARSAVRLWWSGSGEFFYRTSVIIRA